MNGFVEWRPRWLTCYWVYSRWLMLFYKSGTGGPGWFGVMMTSGDAGQSWSEPRRLPNGILGPMKNKPIQLEDGTMLAGEWPVDGPHSLSAFTARAAP